MFDTSVLKDESTDNFALTLKNYNMDGGLSKILYADREGTFRVKGPLGKGLGLSCLSKGTHVAFAAGTGVLVFIDIVAKMLMQTQNLLKDEDQFNKDFKFVFFASFVSREEAIGLDLMEGLANLMREQGSDAFELRLRLSKDEKQKEKPPRWDEPYVRSQL